MVEAGIRVEVVATDRPCRAIELASSLGVASLFVDRAQYGGFKDAFQREGYTRALTDQLVERKIDLVAMAGLVIVKNDTEDSLHERIKVVERTLYPLVVGRVMASLREGFEPSTIAGTVEEG